MFIVGMLCGASATFIFMACVVDWYRRWVHELIEQLHRDEDQLEYQAEVIENHWHETTGQRGVK